MKTLIRDENGQVKLNEKPVDFIFKTENKGIATLYVRDLTVNKLVKTAINVYADDVSLTNRLTEAIAEVTEYVKSIDFNENQGTSVKEAIDNTIELPEDEKKSVDISVAAHLNMLAIEPISRKAIVKFDSIFGDGAMNIVTKARYGRELVPNLLFILKLFCFISSFSAAYASSNLYESIEEIKGRLKSE